MAARHRKCLIYLVSNVWGFFFWRVCLAENVEGEYQVSGTEGQRGSDLNLNMNGARSGKEPGW